MADVSEDNPNGLLGPEQAVNEDHSVIVAPLSRDALDLPATRRPSRFGLAVMASLVLHGAIAWAGINYASDDVLGGAEIEIETISVEIVGAIPKAAVSNPTADDEVRSASTAKPEPQSKAEDDPDRKREPEPPRPLKTFEEPTQDQSSKTTAVEKPEQQTAKVIPEDFPREFPRPEDSVPEPKDVARLPAPPENEMVPPDPAAIVEDFPVGLPRTKAKSLNVPTDPIQPETRPPDTETDKVEEAKPQRTVKKHETKESEVARKAVKPPRKAEKKTENTAKPASRSSSSASNTRAAAQQKVTSASKGALRIFSRKIVRALARSRPRRIAATGTVVVVFTLSESGTLGSVRVRKSSGNSRIDRAALRAVRRAKFPRPPRGATRKQRSFVVPYHFRRR